MPRNTRIHRRPVKGFPPQYARSLGIDEMPKGGIGGSSNGEGRVQILEGWQYPRARVSRDLLVGGQLKARLCDLVR